MRLNRKVIVLVSLAAVGLLQNIAMRRHKIIF